MLTGLVTTLGGVAINKIIDVVNQRIPMSKEQKEQLQADLLKTEVELEKLEIEKMKEKKSLLDTIERVVPLGIPLLLYVLLGMFILNYLSDFIHAQLGRELPIIPIPKELVDFCKVIVMWLFGSKTISRFSPDYMQAKYNKEAE